MAAEAAEYQKQIKQAEKEKEEKTHFDGLDEEAMVQLHSRNVPRSNLIQLKSEINFTPDDEQALGYLVDQFPNDFDTKSDVKVLPKVITKEQLDKQNEQEKA